MQNPTNALPDKRFDAVVKLARGNLRPLLQLDQNGRVCIGGIQPEDKGVEPGRTKRELHLEHDPIVTDAGIAQLMGERAEGVVPGREL